LILSGGPTLALVATCQVELLAGSASFLHLIMYAGICFALIAFRAADYDRYEPSYRVPLSPVLPVVGGLACLDLIYFMQPLSQIVGVGAMLAAGIWRYAYVPAVDLKGVVE